MIVLPSASRPNPPPNKAPNELKIRMRTTIKRLTTRKASPKQLATRRARVISRLPTRTK